MWNYKNLTRKVAEYMLLPVEPKKLKNQHKKVIIVNINEST